MGTQEKPRENLRETFFVSFVSVWLREWCRILYQSPRTVTKTNANMSKGNDFLNKKWCCFGGDKGYCSTIKNFYGCKFILIYQFS